MFFLKSEKNVKYVFSNTGCSTDCCYCCCWWWWWWWC